MGAGMGGGMPGAGMMGGMPGAAGMMGGGMGGYDASGYGACAAPAAQQRLRQEGAALAALACVPATWSSCATRCKASL